MPKSNARAIAATVLVIIAAGVVASLNSDWLDDRRVKRELQRELQEVQGRLAELDDLLQSGYLTRSEFERVLADRGKVIREFAERSGHVPARDDAPRAGGALLAGAPGAAPARQRDDAAGPERERFERWKQAGRDPEIRATWIADRCRDEWSGDFVMQDFCRKEQAKGFSNYLEILVRWRDTDPEAAVGVVSECIDTWVGATPDWVMLHFCLNEQFKAYSRLQP